MECEPHGAYVKVLTFMWLHAQDQASIEEHDDVLSKVTGLPLSRWREIRAELIHPQTGLLTERTVKGIQFLHSPVLARQAEANRAQTELRKKRGALGGRPRKAQGTPVKAQAEIKEAPVKLVKIKPTPKAKAKSTSPKDRPVPQPVDVTDQVWTDFLALRKAKKAPITETALRGFRSEAVKAGLSLHDALALSVTQGWRGFRASWVKERPQQKGRAQERLDRMLEDHRVLIEERKSQ